MVLGEGSVETDYREDLADEVKEYRHLLVYEGERLVDAGVILRPDVTAEGVSITTRALDWHLGDDVAGPFIDDREYISGQEKLSNPTWADGWEFWEVPSEGTWRIDASTGLPLTASMGPNEWPLENEVIASDEKAHAPPGAQFRGAVVLSRDAPYAVGKIRLRHAYDGKFEHPDISSSFASWLMHVRDDITIQPSDPKGWIDGPLARVHTGTANVLLNGDFEEGLLHWLIGGFGGAGNWYIGTDGGGWAGSPSYALTTPAESPNPNEPLKYMLYETDIIVEPGDEWEMRCVVRRHAGAGGDGWAQMACGLVDAVTGNIGGWEISESVGGDVDSIIDTVEGSWRILRGTFTIPEGTNKLRVFMQVHGHGQGQWDFDYASLHRTKGNRCAISSPEYTLIPGRTYRWTTLFHSDPRVVGDGTLRLQAFCHDGDVSQDRGPMTVEGTELGVTDDALHRVVWDFEVPSGLPRVVFQLWSEDVYGDGYVWVGRGTIRDNDPSTTYVETASGITAGPGTLLALTSTAPVGSKEAHLEVVAEAYGLGWRLDSASFTRVTSDPATGEDVARDCLVNPATNQPLLTGGRIFPMGVLNFDYWVQNQDCHKLLTELCMTGLVEPKPEYRMNPDGTADVGPAELVCQDWAPDSDEPVVWGPRDFTVVESMGVSRDHEDAPTDVKVVGADRTSASGEETTYVGRASTDLGSEAVGWFGEPMSRTMLAEDSTLNHADLADSYAAYVLDQSRPRVTVTIQLQGSGLLPPVREGDWVYVYNPEAGLEDPNQDGRLSDGTPVHPVRLRIVSLTRALSVGDHRVEIRRPDGTTWPIPSELVHWEAASGLTLELGDPPAEFNADPQGGSAPRQWIRRVASKRG